MNSHTPKLMHLPGTKLSPEVVLHRTLAKLDAIKSVSIVIQLKDETYATDWSSQTTSELCMVSMVMHDVASLTVRHDLTENVEK